jgi:hypothetical protein
MSGDALIRTQPSPSLEKAMLVCVKRGTAGLPRNAALEIRLFEFHWGTPPPAPAPNTIMRMIRRAPSGPAKPPYFGSSAQA